MPAEDNELMNVWMQRILYALAGFLIYFTFTNLFTTGENTKTSTYRLESRLDVQKNELESFKNFVKNDIDTLRARDIQLTADIAAVTQGLQAGIPRLERIDINTQVLNQKMDERTTDLNKRLDASNEERNRSNAELNKKLDSMGTRLEAFNDLMRSNVGWKGKN